MQTIAIVGAGFSGAVTAVQLMRRASGPLKVVLVNKSGPMARGLAYGTRSPSHLLNVPAGNMSALPDEPDSFLDYCRRVDPAAAAHSFVPRARYGAYLETLLDAAGAASRRDGAQLERVTGEAVEIAPGSVTLADGKRIGCDTVVLAFGHFPPADILPPADIARTGARYVRDPWAGDWLHNAPRDRDVLLVGAGLTALDVIASLDALGHRGRIVCVSRRGLTPHGHRPEGVGERGNGIDGAALAARMGPTLRGQIRTLRAAAEAAAERGDDWRDLFGALRPHTPALWQALSLDDQRRFLRHARPYWETLRHRCAPASLAHLHALQSAARVEVLAGRVGSVLVNDEEGMDVAIRPRGAAGTLTRRVALIVNCTGPGSNPLRSGTPVLERLVAQRHVCADPLGLGLVVDDRYAAVNADGVAQPWLRYIGPMLKARDWEATAVPELRVHAQRLALALLEKPAAAGTPCGSAAASGATG